MTSQHVVWHVIRTIWSCLSFKWKRTGEIRGCFTMEILWRRFATDVVLQVDQFMLVKIGIYLTMFPRRLVGRITFPMYVSRTKNAIWAKISLPFVNTGKHRDWTWSNIQRRPKPSGWRARAQRKLCASVYEVEINFVDNKSQVIDMQHFIRYAYVATSCKSTVIVCGSALLIWIVLMVIN